MDNMTIKSWHIYHNKATEILCSKCLNYGEVECKICQHFDQFLDKNFFNKACECFELAEDWVAWANGDFEYAKDYFRKTLKEVTQQ